MRIIMTFYVISFSIFLVLCKHGLQRSKRHLIFYEGGSCKIVLAVAVPVKLGTKQSMAMGWNIQFQYSQATNSTQLTKPYPPLVSRSKEKREIKSSRSMFYEAVEARLNSFGISGKQCVLKAICDNAMHPLRHNANGIFGELLHIILTPSNNNEESIGSIYKDARKAGEFGVHCATLFPDCQKGIDILNMISIFDQ